MAITRASNSGISTNKALKYNTMLAEIFPLAPTIGTATDVGTARAFNNGSATVAFTPSTSGELATSYTATSSPGSFTGSGSSSPVTVAGLQSSTAYTFTVVGSNINGSSAASAASNSITATTVPQAPTIGTATGGDASASITFTGNATGGKAITTYTATSSPGGFTGTSATSPITVSGLANGTSYTFTVTATNANGTSTASSASNSVTPAAPLSFESIATATGTGGSSTISFTSIPQTYTHLQIRYIAKSTQTGSVNRYPWTIQFNNNVSAIYSSATMWSNGSTVTTNNLQDYTGIYSNQPIIPNSSTTYNGIYGTGIIDIMNYSKSTNYSKSLTAFCGMETGSAGTISNTLYVEGNFNSSNVGISRIDLTVETGSFNTSSVFALYGIKG